MYVTLIAEEMMWTELRVLYTKVYCLVGCLLISLICRICDYVEKYLYHDGVEKIFAL
jgi:hypothetical protein